MKKVFALAEGSYTVAIDKKFIPFNPARDNIKDRPASLLVEIQPFVVKTGNDLLMLDTGLGYFNPEGKMILHQNLEKHGISPEQITKVLLSHLHFDHTGGCVYADNKHLKMAFPKAEYFVQKGEFEKASATPSKSYHADILETLNKSGQMVLVEGSGNITSEIKYELSGGHTEFHQVFTIDTSGHRYFFGGDVLPDLYQLIIGFVAKYDFDGKRCADLRVEYGHRSIEEDTMLLFYHSLKVPMCKVKFTDGGFRMA